MYVQAPECKLLCSAGASEGYKRQGVHTAPTWTGSTWGRQRSLWATAAVHVPAAPVRVLLMVLLVVLLLW